jgi:hypothetical protein
LRGSLGASQLLTRAPVDLALALFGLSLLCPPPLADANVGKTLTLDGSYLSACTHYLVFKEPETRPAISRLLGRGPHRSAELAGFRGTFQGY